MYIEDLKFSLWCDFVERSFLETEFVDLINAGTINGATSNPAIFKSAILTSPAYKKDIEAMQDLTPKETYEALAIKDIKKAAEKLLPLYKKGDDGFISIEVDPFLCDDANGTIEEGRRLFQQIDMPNVMIKVPATKAGYVAMQQLISEGINVNATLIFSVEQTKHCLEAFKAGSASCQASVLPKAVISVFVSRFDRMLDTKLAALDLPVSKVGIYNALNVYRLIERYALSNVRCLFASTGVKGDALEADYYIKGLLCKNSINTAPLATIKYFIQQSCDNNVPKEEEIELFFDTIKKSGIDVDAACDALMQDGLESFKVAFQEILETLSSYKR
ncbi:transaldolase [Sulfurospirillum sp. 1612]|uniref:transaldolase n=1 Tax=Sulfurospirillum sp. 1612 TaxID=3094835 RepID=UPI002F93AB0E